PCCRCLAWQVYTPGVSSRRASIGSSLLLLHGDPAHRSPHSFPTRRSSDLHPATVRRCPGAGPAVRARRAARAAGADRASPPSCRSEEHTSELQSRENLVCRLLLEKKKTK